jgi:hypothetical protein
VVGGALVGMFLRTILPEHHLNAASKDIVKLVMGLVATLAALVLGLLVASAKSSFDLVNDGFRQSAARVILLDRTLAQYGPESRELRGLIRKSMAARVEQLFAKDGSPHAKLSSSQGTAAIEGAQQGIRALSPQNEIQRAMQSRAIDLMEAVTQARWLAIEEEDNRIPTPFLVILVFWLAVMFTSFGLFAPRNAIAVAVLFLGAASLAAAVFLIEELYDPLDGVIAISSAPMYKALSLLGQ